ncbi:FecR family protein [Chitinophaga nivalis]|uniref:FecR domain-containing protein n=1 Tax=Chitinophaga nivalis TaxID=2991709 RepID=A0ABT3ILD8_9BACT|nr:FecR domain-containing protein [Chitinophaga nivalis]MCW3465520.1 FecR domain-containing protein [Chitinophaga nivalis]MCW3484789.1 FecR domain-containing protein [Chitinophaga nivalis]
MEQFDTYIHELIVKQLSAQCTETEAAAIQQWLDTSADNKVTYQKLVQIWQDAPRGTLPERQYHTAAAWDKTEAALFPATTTQTGKVRRMGFRYAAAAAILLLLTAGAWWLASRPSLKQQELAANDGKIKSLQLADKSVVTLRQGARIRYSNGYHHDQRIVELEGEAFFEVANDPGHPFLVKTPNQSVIEVLGTSFTVQAREDQTLVIVASGKVRLGEANNPSAVILTSGQKGVWDKGTVSARDNDNLNFIAWKTGILQFNDQSLVVILAQLADFYGKDIRISDDYQETASKQKATVTFQHQSCDDVLHELQLLLGFNYKQEGDTIVIGK